MLERQIAESLLLPEPYILRIAATASYMYKQYEIPKRNGGRRRIEHPSGELKAIQRWLSHNIISRFPVDPNAFAYVEGRGIRENARQHLNSKYMLKMDFRNFFPSIRSSDVEYFLRVNSGCLDSGWSEEDCLLFSSLVCRNGRLTIGAPSSPSLSNVMCFRLDQDLGALAAGMNLRYSRYADDICFSTEGEERLPDCLEQAVNETIRGLVCPKKLTLNKKKTRYTSGASRQSVTGLIITCDEAISVGRKKKRHLKSMVFRWHDLDGKERSYLSGYLSFLRHIEPDFVAALNIKYPDNMKCIAEFNKEDS